MHVFNVFVKICMTNFHENSPKVNWAFYVNRRTDTHDEANCRLRNCFGNAPKMAKPHLCISHVPFCNQAKSTLALKTLTMVSVLRVSVRRKQIQDTSTVTVYFTAWLLLSLRFKKYWLSSPVTQKVNSPYISPPKIIHDSELCQVHSETFFASFYYTISLLQDYKYNLCSRT